MSASGAGMVPGRRAQVRPERYDGLRQELPPICYLVERVADNRDEQLVVSAAYGVHRTTD